MYFLDRKRKQLVDQDLLFKSIVEETGRLKREMLGLGLLRLSRALGRMKGAVAAALKPKPFFPKCMDTVNISNLGIPFAGAPLLDAESQLLKAGDLVLQRIELLPPFRDHTHGSFGVASYNGKMVITFHYDARYLTSDLADQFVQVYEDLIRQTTS